MTLGGRPITVPPRDGVVPSASEGQTFDVITYSSHSGTKFKAIAGQLVPSPSDLGYAAVGASAVTLTLKHAADMSVTRTGPTNPVHGSPITYTETATEGDVWIAELR